MLNRKYPAVENEGAPNTEMQKSLPIGLIVASMVGFLVWLVFIVTLCITGLVIGLMWIIWGRDRMQMWSQW